MSENNELEKKEPVTEELSPEQMGKASGAGIIDRIGCFFNGHGTFRNIGQKYSKGNYYNKMECEDCGLIRYYKNDVECSESEYNSVKNESVRVFVGGKEI